MLTTTWFSQNSCEVEFQYISLISTECSPGMSLKDIEVYKYYSEDTGNWHHTGLKMKWIKLVFFCVTDVNDCKINSCHNGGTCLDGLNEFTCQCMKGFEGDFCEKGNRM